MSGRRETSRSKTGCFGADGGSQIAGGQVSDEQAVLNKERLVQAQPLGFLLTKFWGGVYGQQHVQRIPHHAAQGKDNHADDEQGDQALEDSSGYVALHEVS